MDKGINQIINSYILCLQKENLKFTKVYLFGSYAKNKQSAHSDIDLAFIFDENKQIDYFDLQVQMLSLASYIDTRIEPHPMSSEDFTPENPLACEILNTGMEISLQTHQTI
ncbi:MAG: nucleotidyltransferase domain-containing protein [Prolixibacteraceae bacterium]|jgi:predicted nucleotidyltransferase|nr:nucleotidyltransferase domain-containing protein [Prolixibacteraceae bacterium]